jgi:hypothetical protein
MQGTLADRPAMEPLVFDGRPPNPKNTPRRKPSTLTAHTLAISRTRISCLAAPSEATRAFGARVPLNQ